MKWLIFGAKGWIGQQLCDILEKNNEQIIKTDIRADSESQVESEIIKTKPDRIISLIGRTHGPGISTIDYLEQKGKLKENIQDNLYGPIVLAILSTKYNIHYTYLGTGCIFNGYKNNIGYVESDKPDFFGSSYSIVKGFTDRYMHFFEDKILNIRIRMPIVANMHPRNFITKILTYKKICSIPNSMTVLPELLPIMLDMAKNKTTGTINLVNPGLITHNEILELVKKYKKPDLKWENFSLEDQQKILLSDRSNNLLNTDKLTKLYPELQNIKDSVKNIIISMDF